MRYIGDLATDKEILNSNCDIVIYGIGGYGEKIYRNLKFYNKQKNVKAFTDKNLLTNQEFFHGIPIININEVMKNFSDSIVCIGGETVENIKDLELLEELENVHQIVFNINCKLYGTEYGGFYLPENFIKNSSVVYSFGIGEDLSFSEAVIEEGGYVYAFDPTPKSIRFVKNHKLFSNPNFHFFPYGLSDTDGKRKFYLPIREDWVSASVIPHRNVNNENIIQVEMKTLRTIMKELKHEHLDILKMDIEGAEFEVISDLLNPELCSVDFKLCALETHERFLADRKECVNKLYNTMMDSGFYDFYGTDKEPSFIKI